MAHDMMDAPSPCNFRCSVIAAIVNHKDFDDVDPIDRARDRGQRCRKVLGFIEAGYLDDKLGQMASGELRINTHFGAQSSV